MALETNANLPAVVKRSDRTRRIIIDTPYGDVGEYSITFVREIIDINPDDGQIVRMIGSGQVTKKFSEVEADTVTLPSGVVVPAKLVYAALAAFADKYRSEQLGA